jgi:hypothetical protein
MKYFLGFVITIVLFSCGGDSAARKTIEDLPFRKAENPKAYADLILKAIRTDRDDPIYTEFKDRSDIDADSLMQFIGMYSSAIRGRDDWDYVDVHGDGDLTKDIDGYDYAWLDQSGRLGLQIKVFPEGSAQGFRLKRIEFRSRLDVVHSQAFPGGMISDYKKLDYDWEARMKRRLEAKKATSDSQ